MSEQQKIDDLRSEVADTNRQIHSDLAEDDAAVGRFAQAERQSWHRRFDELRARLRRRHPEDRPPR
jgi:hypothetical protein